MSGVSGISLNLDQYRNNAYLTHNFHPYPAKYIPQIPAALIQSLSNEGDYVLDPFCGSGTTLVESRLLGRNSVGVDVNPLACLVSRVKTTDLSDDECRIAELVADNVLFDILGGAQHPSPIFFNIDHWFEPTVQNELSVIKAVINATENDRVRDFLQVAFAAIIVKVSNQESDTRYKAVKKNLQPGDVGRYFQTKVFDMIKRMSEFRRVATSSIAQVIQGDATNLGLSRETFDLVVTSPPYLNSYDYYLYHKQRMMWLDLDYRSAQEKEFGSRNKHNDHGLGLESYNEPVERSAALIRECLKPGGYYCVVIGDGILRGQLIKMNHNFDSIIVPLGFDKAREITFDQRKYTRTFTPNMRTRYKESYVLIYRKPTDSDTVFYPRS